MRQKKGLDYSYKKIKDHTEKVIELPNGGIWLPISVAGLLSNYSGVTIRHLITNGKVKAIQFNVGPVLINYNDILENWLKK